MLPKQHNTNTLLENNLLQSQSKAQNTSRTHNAHSNTTSGNGGTTGRSSRSMNRRSRSRSSLTGSGRSRRDSAAHSSTGRLGRASGRTSGRTSGSSASRGRNNTGGSSGRGIERVSSRDIEAVGAGSPGLDAAGQVVVPSRQGTGVDLRHDGGAGGRVHDVGQPGSRNRGRDDAQDGAGDRVEEVRVVRAGGGRGAGALGGGQGGAGEEEGGDELELHFELGCRESVWVYKRMVGLVNCVQG